MGVHIPRSLLELPQPWSRLDETLSSDLDQNDETFANALEALAKAQQGLTEIPPVEPDVLPGQLDEYWGFLASTLSVDMPTFADFDLAKVATLVRAQEPNAGVDLVEIAGRRFVHFAASGVFRRALRWLASAARKQSATNATARLSEFLQRNWRSASDPDAFSMLLTLRSLDEDGGRRTIASALGDPAVSAWLKAELEDLAE